jgi:hypothetical protein
MERDRGWRRAQTERVRQRRIKNWSWLGWGMSESAQGQARKSHFGCGCGMCKPWKHGWCKTDRETVSVRRKSQED